MKLWSERKIPCRVIIMINFKLVRVIELFALLPSLHLITRLPSNLFKTLTFSCCHQYGYPKRNYKKFLWILWLKQVGFLDNTLIFITKLQKMHFTLHPAREFSLASIFHSRVTLKFTNLAAQQIYRWIKKTVERVHYYKF